MKIENDDPILTAYALGELSEVDRRAVEAELAMNPAARAAVNEIRATADLLSQQLQLQQLKETDALKQMKLEPIQLPKSATSSSATKVADRVQGWPARVFTVAVAASIVLVVGGIPLAIILGNRNKNVAIDVKPRTQNEHVERSAQPELALAPSTMPSLPLTSEHSPVAHVHPVDRTNNASVAPSVDAVAATVAPKVDSAGTATSSIPAPSGSLVVRGTPYQAYNQRPLARVPLNERAYGKVGVQREIRGGLHAPAAHDQQGHQGQGQNQANQIPADRQDLIRAGEKVEAPSNTETYAQFNDNKFLSVGENPLSTFSIDVDTASYSTIRRFIKQNTLPPKQAVRIEEMLNYFPYEYAGPAQDAKDPFASHVEIAECPWQPEHRLVRVALKAKTIDISKRPSSNLVFLIDVSGSMQDGNKLPLLKASMKLLVQQLDERDRVAIVVYAGNTGIVLPSTSCANKQPILDTLDQLESGGSTNGAGGIQLAYEAAVSSFIEKGSNRVILCTDGDFNVGISDPDSLQNLIEQKAKSGVFLSVLGFGMGNTKDATMERLADKGNGNYAYIDSLEEGRKVLVEQMAGTLLTIAKDVKIQIEFNPAKASAYRLIGYENRLLEKEDFNDDKKDAGEIGAGHAVTALYEVVPAGKTTATTSGSGAGVDPLKYQKPRVTSAPEAATTGQSSNELLTLKMRYKQPDGDVSKLMEVPVTDAGKSLLTASTDFRFASAVAELGMILRGSPYKGSATYASVIELADSARGTDPSGYRKEFVDLVYKARALANPK